jgi:hypothetical protein
MSWTQPFRVRVSEVKGEVGVNWCQPQPVTLYLFIEERTGTDLIENVPVNSNWLGVGARRMVLVCWSVNLLAPEASNYHPSRNFLAWPSFGIKFSICCILILGFQMINLR